MMKDNLKLDIERAFLGMLMLGVMLGFLLSISTRWYWDILIIILVIILQVIISFNYIKLIEERNNL